LNTPTIDRIAVSKRILITSAGSGPSNNLMRSLLHADASTFIVGCHSDRFLLKKSAAHRNFLLPALSNDHDRDAFDRALRLLVQTEKIDLIIPGNDYDVRLIAAIEQRQHLSCRTFLPALKTINLCQDKYVLNVLLREHGIPVPRTYPIVDQRSLLDAWHTLKPTELAWCRIRRGFASRGATKVCDPDQAWGWISYWHTMRGIPVAEFTLCEFLPGRDYNVQGLWLDGRLLLIKMCERLSYLNADQHPSGMASTPALAKTVWEQPAIEACEAAIRALDPHATGVFNFDLKENDRDVPCITEINAGRFAMITNIYDLTGRYNMAECYVSLACDKTIVIDDPYDYAGEHYLIRELDAAPSVIAADELFEGIEALQ
jgi:predicted ATP-grasp superfamily ATP-dependent carboligase